MGNESFSHFIKPILNCPSVARQPFASIRAAHSKVGRPPRKPFKSLANSISFSFPPTEANLYLGVGTTPMRDRAIHPNPRGGRMNQGEWRDEMDNWLETFPWLWFCSLTLRPGLSEAQAGWRLRQLD